MNLPSTTGAVETARSGTTGARFGVVLVRAIFAALVVHAAFVGLFLWLRIDVLALFNLGSTALYAACLAVARRGPLARALLLVVAAGSVEVVAHAWLAVAHLGWESGFHYYMLVLAPAVFFNRRWRLPGKLAYVALVCAAYVGMHQWAQHYPPRAAVDASLLSALNYFNVMASFLLLGYLSHYYSKGAAAAFKQLKHLAGTDPLTGLLNRRRMQEIADQERARHARLGRSYALIITDIDDFKHFNDEYGHECGDRVLETIAGCARESLRAEDHLARWGGEELLALLPETGLAGAAAAAEKLRVAVAASHIDCGLTSLGVTLTAGVAVCGPHEAFANCIARADHALLQGKSRGKNCVVSVGE
jgi:diguanylate cyclase (GGDEF)-like protein